MRRTVLCLALLLLPSAAFAGNGIWSADMQEDEGGSVMVASVSADKVDGLVPTLSIGCAGDQGVMLRYEMPSDDGQTGASANFLFENESTQVTKSMQYEDEDGAFAAYFPKTDPILGLLKTGDTVFVSESTGNYPAQTFPLQGSGRAIDTVVKRCR